MGTPRGPVERVARQMSEDLEEFSEPEQLDREDSLAVQTSQPAGVPETEEIPETETETTEAEANPLADVKKVSVEEAVALVKFAQSFRRKFKKPINKAKAVTVTPAWREIDPKTPQFAPSNESTSVGHHQWGQNELEEAETETVEK